MPRLFVALPLLIGRYETNNTFVKLLAYGFEKKLLINFLSNCIDLKLLLQRNAKNNQLSQ